MKLEPKSAKDVEAAGLIPRGVKDFEVLKATEETSSAGNEMLHLKLGIEHDGRVRWVDDYLVSTEGMAYKVRHFAESVGLLAEYEAGELHAADAEGRAGKCRVGIKKAEGDYPAKNRIVDYVPAFGTGVPMPSKTPDLIDDSEIPF